MKKKTKNILIVFCIVAVVIVAVGGGFAYSYYRTFYASNISLINEKNNYINIDEDVQDIDTLLLRLNELIEVKNMKTLKTAIEKLEFSKVRTGHYVFHKEMTNKQLVTMLKLGWQTPIRLTFNNIHTKEQLALRLSNQLMIDSTTIITFLNNEDSISIHGFTSQTVVAAFIPNTYEVYWNTSVNNLFKKMMNEYKRFWNDERLAKAAEIPLSPIEVSTLASIVEGETNKEFEYPIVAGLYINRLRKGMRLQACPTVIFAVGDFTLRRVLTVHTEYDSPYNTYIYAGLPPGPIRIASPKAIDAVLNYERNNYIYMVADSQLNGTHRFSTTLTEHNKSANEYRQELNKRKIYK